MDLKCSLLAWQPRYYFRFVFTTPFFFFLFFVFVIRFFDHTFGTQEE